MCNSESDNYSLCGVVYICVSVLELFAVPHRPECKLWVRAVSSDGLCIYFREQQKKNTIQKISCIKMQYVNSV